jgi:hypothetical protein
VYCEELVLETEPSFLYLESLKDRIPGIVRLGQPSFCLINES